MADMVIKCLKLSFPHLKATLITCGVSRDSKQE